MKKIRSILLILIAACFTVAPCHAQMWAGAGNKVDFTYPTGLTGKNHYTFPSFHADTVSTADSMKVTVKSQEEYIKINTLTGAHANILVLTPGAGLLPGCKLYLYGSVADSTHNVFINQGSTRLDTFIVKSSASTMFMLWDGNRYKRFTY